MMKVTDKEGAQEEIHDAWRVRCWVGGWGGWGQCSPGITHDCDSLRVNVSPRGDEWNNFHRAQTQREPRCRGLESKSGDSDKNNCSDYSWYTSRSRYSCGVHPHLPTNTPQPTHLYFIFNSLNPLHLSVSVCKRLRQRFHIVTEKRINQTEQPTSRLPPCLVGWPTGSLAGWLAGLLAARR